MKITKTDDGYRLDVSDTEAERLRIALNEHLSALEIDSEHLARDMRDVLAARHETERDFFEEGSMAPCDAIEPMVRSLLAQGRTVAASDVWDGHVDSHDDDECAAVWPEVDVVSRFADLMPVVENEQSWDGSGAHA